MIRRAMWLTVTAVAVFGAVISYTHIYAIARTHGGSPLASVVLPLSVDGLIVAASVLLLHEALAGRRAPFLGRLMLVAGVGVTVAVNVSYGAAWGVAGALLWSWPAVAFVGAAELLIILLRRVGRLRAAGPADTVPAWVPESGKAAQLHAAQLAFEASRKGGNPLSQNALTTKFGVTRSQARQIRAGMNGSERP